MSEVQKRLNRRKIFHAKVLSDKMMKTRVVQVQWTTKHAQYDKVVRGFSKFKAHDEKNVSKEGDTVAIMETRPLSKDKRWIITEVVKKA
jgi:small subunit ribosomal protein S17